MAQKRVRDDDSSGEAPAAKAEAPAPKKGKAKKKRKNDEEDEEEEAEAVAAAAVKSDALVGMKFAVLGTKADVGEKGLRDLILCSQNTCFFFKE